MTTTINVERTEVLRTGTNKNTNRPWTLFQVFGTHADGTPLQNVKTFDMLGVGPTDVHLLDDQRDADWKVARLPRDSRNTTVRPQSSGSTSNLEARVTALEDEVRKLNKQLAYIITNPDIELPE